MPILETILPVLIIVLAGFLSVRSRHLSPADADSIATFVFTYPIPLLLFLGTVNARFPENMEWAFLLSYYLALIVVFLLTLGLSRMARGFSSPEQSVFSTAAVYANTTVIGIPVVMLVLGESALLPLFIIISIHNLVLFSLGILFAERDTLTLPSLLGNTRGILMQLLSSPITASLMLGGCSISWISRSIHLSRRPCESSVRPPSQPPYSCLAQPSINTGFRAISAMRCCWSA